MLVVVGFGRLLRASSKLLSKEPASGLRCIALLEGSCCISTARALWMNSALGYLCIFLTNSLGLHHHSNLIWDLFY
jgi:hypothetical protein